LAGVFKPKDYEQIIELVISHDGIKAVFGEKIENQKSNLS
jgi:hypothetical protein